FAELMRRAGVEATISAVRKPRDLAIGVFRDRIVALLEHEGRHAQQAQLAGGGTEIVDRLLHGVADIHQRLHALFFGLVARVAEHLADLGMAATAVDRRHQLGKAVAGGNPPGGAAFAKPAKIDELDVEAAGAGRGAKHVGLQRAGRVPGRLPAHGGVERKDQPAALARRACRPERAYALEERGNLRPGRRRRRGLIGTVFGHEWTAYTNSGRRFSVRTGLPRPRAACLPAYKTQMPGRKPGMTPNCAGNDRPSR